MTPLIFKKELFELSGHWKNYKEDMFMINNCCNNNNNEENQIELEESGLKPMNCPAHCLIFDSEPRHEKDLPIRLADFGTLHRNEASGALTGLTRVRQFHQDDGHIFCRPDQIQTEITSSLKMVDDIYNLLNLNKYRLFLSTKPIKSIGDSNLWDLAEQALTESLNQTKKPWSIKQGDGAFYGPKIDIEIQDNLGKWHQTATIQLDFQLPKRFNLKYINSTKGTTTPVIVHRAIFGSLERMLALLIEKFNGRWPFWLSFRQLIILPTNSNQNILDYSKNIEQLLNKKLLDKFNLNLDIQLDHSNKSLTNKIKQAQLDQFNFMLIIGDKELESNKLSLRNRDGTIENNVDIDHLVDKLANMVKQYLS